MECGDLALRISQSQSGSLRLKMGEAFFLFCFVFHAGSWLPLPDSVSLKE